MPPDERRLFAAGGFLAFFIAIIVVRLFFIQAWQKQKYEKMADKQYIIEIPIAAHRGLILDRNLAYLALNEPCVSIGLDKRQMQSTSRQYARLLGRVLHENVNKLQRRITSTRGNFVWLKRRIDLEFGPKIAALNLPGIRVEKDIRRIYPHHEVASHVLGFTDPDNRGIEGAELGFNDLLTGRNGRVIIQRDGRGRAVPEIVLDQVAPREGTSIVLTIDYIIQTIATEELRAAVREYNARSGTVIVCEPNTGEILAIANEPTYNPNTPIRSLASHRRNRAVTDSYEPGSTFKIVTFAALLEHHLKKPEDLVYCENGTFRSNGRLIRDTKAHGYLILADVLANSSNIGTVKMAQEVGAARLYKMARKFGFGRESGIDLPGEAAGLLKRPENWSSFSLASQAIGQEVSVNAIQLAMAYAAIANGGFRVQPRVLKGYIDAQGEMVPAQNAGRRQRILSPETARTLTRLLRRAVERGTGKPGRIEGLAVAGKTGTAQKALPRGGGYSATEFVSNFAGFFPAEAPKYLVYVMLDTDKQHQWGRFAAATFKRIAQRIRVQEKRLYTRRTPAGPAPADDGSERIREVSGVVLPDFANRRSALAQQALEALGLQVRVQGHGAFVLSQSPGPGTFVNAGDEVVLQLFEVEKKDGLIKMPSVIGLSLREALNRLSIQSLDPVVYGHGKVVAQKPAPGSLVRTGIRCVIECTAPAVKPRTHSNALME